MTRNLTLVCNLLFLLAFNIIFFYASGSNHSAPVWICYAFLHLATIMGVIVPLIDAKGKTAYESKLSSLLISIVYTVIEIILTLIVVLYEVLANQEAGSIVILPVQITLTVIFFVLLFSNLLVNRDIAQKQTVHDNANSFIKTISATIKYIESIATDPKQKQQVNDLYNLAHASQIKTSESVKIQEQQITDLLAELESKVDGKDNAASQNLLEELTKLITKRNIILKSKH